MNEKDLTKILENLEVPEILNPSHKALLRSSLLAEMEAKQKSSFNFRNFINNGIYMKRFSFALVLIILLAVSVIYFNKYNKSTSIVQNQQTPTTTPIKLASGDTKTINWHDPANTVLGYKFDIPNNWVEEASSERSITVASCQPNTPGCDHSSLNIYVASDSQTMNYIDNLNSGYVASLYGYIVSTTTVGGIPATLLSEAKNPIEGNIIYFNKDGEWFLFSFFPGQKNIKENYDLLNKIVATFAFTEKQTSLPPAEFALLKDVDKWQLTYQKLNNDSNYYTNLMLCTNGTKGNTLNANVFALDSRGYGEAPGDVDTPYNKAVGILKNNGWTECGVPIDQQDPSEGHPNQIFIKNGKLIGIFKHYSMGVGNSLEVLIQYDK